MEIKEFYKIMYETDNEKFDLYHQRHFAHNIIHAYVEAKTKKQPMTEGEVDDLFNRMDTSMSSYLYKRPGVSAFLKFIKECPRASLLQYSDGVIRDIKGESMEWLIDLFPCGPFEYCVPLLNDHTLSVFHGKGSIAIVISTNIRWRSGNLLVDDIFVFYKDTDITDSDSEYRVAIPGDFNPDGTHKLTGTIYDTRGFSRRGINRFGFGANTKHIETNTIYDSEGLNVEERYYKEGLVHPLSLPENNGEYPLTKYSFPWSQLYVSIILNTAIPYKESRIPSDVQAYIVTNFYSEFGNLFGDQ